MKCRKCQGRAAFNMRHHKLALCQEHYLEWFQEQTKRSIERYRMFAPDDRVLVAVSGGKDSLSMWDTLLRLGYQAGGMYVNLGIDGGTGYSAKSLQKIEQFTQNRPEAVLHVECLIISSMIKLLY